MRPVRACRSGGKPRPRASRTDAPLASARRMAYGRAMSAPPALTFSDDQAEAWDSLNSDTSRPFPKPTTGRFAVKVINHLGDEVMKVFKVG